MMRFGYHTALLVIAALLLPIDHAHAQSEGQTREEARLINATQVLQELRGWQTAAMVRRYAHFAVEHLPAYANRSALVAAEVHGTNLAHAPEAANA